MQNSNEKQRLDRGFLIEKIIFVPVRFLITSLDRIMGIAVKIQHFPKILFGMIKKGDLHE